jgi:4-hydroxy-tetrahydrodipicolinate synthase
MSELCKAAMAGDTKRAMEIQFKLMPCTRACLSKPIPFP